MPAPLAVGLTGGIASGKTLVEAIFRELGVPVLDADQVSRNVVRPPSPALDRIAAEFGPQFLLADGNLNRPLMRQHVFADAAERKRLEAILHPLMFRQIGDWLAARSEPYCVLSAAILAETGLRRLVQRVLVVDVPRELQHRRLLARDGISEALADSMLAAQASREQRLQSADDVIDNSGSIEQTRGQVLGLHAEYLRAARPAG